MIRKLLIANRGEIACRIMRTCRELGIATAAVYSDADADGPHVRQADEAVHIGPAPARDSYLKIEAIVDAVQRTGADAVHPGYGFLAENADFARAVTSAGAIFVGPPAKVIEQMGSKIEAKRIAQSAGVPVVPGYDGGDQSDARMIAEAERIGWPIMIKASAGGGGKGMREVAEPGDMVEALAAARREAQAAFGDAALMLEKRILRPRHVEVQIMGDMHGTVIALGERECSLQRRHQKIIEESPSTALDEALRERMCAAAVALGQAIGYVNAGTVEFLLDADGQFYFLEVNARLQVEHPVTEMVRGLDLVRMQIEIAEGGHVPAAPSQPYGHAIEARIYAEDPARGFLPSIGRILAWNGGDIAANPNASRFWNWAGLIVDAGVERGTLITPDYDPTVAKVIAFGEDRAQALRRLDHALARLCLLGVRSNIAFLRRLLAHDDFTAGAFDTGFIDRHPELLADPAPPPHVWIAAALARAHAASPPAGIAAGWRNNAYRPLRHTFSHDDDERTVEITPQGADTYRVSLGDHTAHVRVAAIEDGALTLIIDGHRQRIWAAEGDGGVWWVGTGEGAWPLTWVDPLPIGSAAKRGEGSLRAPMPGSIVSVQVEPGQAVAEGDLLMIMEAMKMEHRIRAPHAGVIGAVHFAVGQFAQAGAVLLELERTD